jgi:3',5'-cyclic AMP phosphodiesterase CpdA
MKIKILSDLHLEFYKTLERAPIQYIEANADILILAGDIGYPGSSLYKEFIDLMAKRFKHVILITGNHEYYVTCARKWDVDTVDKYLKELVKEWSNVHYLNNESIMIEGYKFLGTTLWTKILNEDYIDVAFQMNDYKKIYFNSRQTISPHHTINWHQNSIKWLQEEFKEVVPTIVVTHHAPSIRKEVSNPNHLKMKSAYINDLESIIPKHILLWAYGHTHFSADFICENEVTRIVNNPFGYKGEFLKERQIETGSKFITVPDL